MSLDLTTATARIARELGESEVAIADALAKTTALLHSAAMAGRDVPGAPKIESQRALLRLQKIVGGLIEARGEAARVHDQLLTNPIFSASQLQVYWILKATYNIMIL